MSAHFWVTRTPVGGSRHSRGVNNGFREAAVRLVIRGGEVGEQRSLDWCSDTRIGMIYIVARRITRDR